ncbi:MAG TPA: hypothetical protein VJ717_20165 [Gemmatimonadaceae bacterium]|nr:hypothetical protein [Gemmatimonadaceae bacterium]
MAEITRDQDVGKRVEESMKRPVVAGWVRKLVRADLVRTAGDGNGANRREVRLRNTRLRRGA